MAAVALSLAAQVVLQAALRGAPQQSPGLVLELPAFYRDHSAALITQAVLLGASYLLTGLALDRLYQATKARRPETPAAARILAWVGAIALAVTLPASQIAVMLSAGSYLASGAGDYFAARAALSPGPLGALELIGRAGTLALAFAFILVAMNAMRAGLLTRFMGILGIFAGVLLVIPLGNVLATAFGIPLGGQPPVVQWFWLGALAYLLSGRWPGGVPPAWRTGRAEPWPTPQQLHERREAARTDGRRERADSPRAATAGVPDDTGAQPSRPRPASRKRKGRKRR